MNTRQVLSRLRLPGPNGFIGLIGFKMFIEPVGPIALELGGTWRIFGSSFFIEILNVFVNDFLKNRRL